MPRAGRCWSASTAPCGRRGARPRRCSRSTPRCVRPCSRASGTSAPPSSARERSRHAVSHNGTLGHEARQFRGYQYPWPTGALFVMHSDGLLSHWQIADYPGLIQRHPALIAAVLYRDFSAVATTSPWSSDESRHEPAAAHRSDHARARRRQRASTRPRTGGRLRLRSGRADPHRHRGVRDRAQRVRLRPRWSRRFHAGRVDPAAVVRRSRP